MTRVLFIGCGDLGQRSGKLLHSKGVDVWGMRRRVEAVPEPLFPVWGDASQSKGLDAIKKLPQPVDVVVVTPTAPSYSREAYKTGYVDAVLNLLQTLDRSQLSPLIILVSSVSVYGAHPDGEWIDEFSPASPNNWRGQTLLEAESCVRRSGLNYSILRVAGLYGASDATLRRALWSLPTEEDTAPVNRIHRDDCAALMARLVEYHLAGRGVPPLVVGCDGTATPQAEVINWIRKEVQHLNEGKLPEISERPPQRQRVANSRRIRSALMQELEFSFLYPDFRAGYTKLVRKWVASL